MAGLKSPPTITHSASAKLVIIQRTAVAANPATNQRDAAGNGCRYQRNNTDKAEANLLRNSTSYRPARRPEMSISGNIVIVNHASGGREDNAPKIDSTRVNSGYYDKGKSKSS